MLLRNHCEKFARLMQGEFEMSMMGELTFFPRLQIKQLEEGIVISQTKYIKEILKKFGSSTRTVGTPMSNSCKLDENEGGQSIDQKLYDGMIGSLLYLMAGRLDILFSVGMCARFQSNPKEIHHQATKRIFKYLEYTQHLGLWYSKSSSFELVAYSDSDFGGCKLGRRSTSGTCHFLGGNLVSWSSRKQNSIALSSTEAEYIAAGSCCAQSLWIKY